MRGPTGGQALSVTCAKDEGCFLLPGNDGDAFRGLQQFARNGFIRSAHDFPKNTGRGTHTRDVVIAVRGRECRQNQTWNNHRNEYEPFQHESSFSIFAAYWTAALIVDLHC